MTKEQRDILNQLKQAIKDEYQRGQESILAQGIPVPLEDLYSFLHCSIQYAVGRRTYITDTVSSQVRAYWKHLTTAQHATLTRNLRADMEAFYRRDQKVGDACDDASWRSLLEWMEQQIKESA